MHDAYVGSTGSGKTYLAIEKAAAYLDAGVNVLVCDPFFSKWPTPRKSSPVTLWRTHLREPFMAAARRSRRCALMIDEGGQTLARDPDAEWLFTGARQWGHKTHAMLQDGIQMLPVMRGQCSTVAIFGPVDLRVAKLWAEAKVCPGLLAAAQPDFPEFEFLLWQKRMPLRRLKISA